MHEEIIIQQKIFKKKKKQPQYKDIQELILVISGKLMTMAVEDAKVALDEIFPAFDWSLTRVGEGTDTYIKFVYKANSRFQGIVKATPTGIHFVS